MKIELDVTHTTKAEYEVEFPVYLQNSNAYYCFFDPEDFKRNIKVVDYSISKGVDYCTNYETIGRILENEATVHITKEVFQNKLVEILKIINGAVDEMHKADEQQKGS